MGSFNAHQLGFRDSAPSAAEDASGPDNLQAGFLSGPVFWMLVLILVLVGLAVMWEYAEPD